MDTVAVKERPILFGSDSVRAILAGKKVQTRRVVMPQPKVPVRYDGADDDVEGEPYTHYWEELDESGGFTERYPSFSCPYGKPGDRLWVKQDYRFLARFDFDKPSQVPRNQFENILP